MGFPSLTTDTLAAMIVKAPAAFGAAVATSTLVTQLEEPMVPVIGVPQSLLLAAVVGALIGVLILPDQDTNRVSADNATSARWRRILQLALRIGLLGGVVLAYAVLAAWLVSIIGIWFPAMGTGPQLPLAGISGVIIRRMLPKYLQVVERATEWVGGRTP